MGQQQQQERWSRRGNLIRVTPYSKGTGKDRTRSKKYGNPWHQQGGGNTANAGDGSNAAAGSGGGNDGSQSKNDQTKDDGQEWRFGDGECPNAERGFHNLASRAQCKRRRRGQAPGQRLLRSSAAW